MMKTIFTSILLAITILPAHAEPLPIADTHIHYSHDAWTIFPPSQIVKMLQEAGVRHAFVSSSNDDGTQMLYKEAPDLIVPVLRPYTRRGQTSTWMDSPDILQHVKDRLKTYQYEGIGEFHVFGDKTDSIGVRGIIALAKEYDLFLHAHSDQKAVHNIFKQFPKARVLWAHSGFDRPDEVAAMLAQYDNLWADLAFRSDHATRGEVEPEWRELFEEFPDRIMLGTDTFTPERWPMVGAHAEWSRQWLNTLPKELAENIAWRNAENLLAQKGKQQ